MLISGQFSCQRPYHAERTGSRPITEVKQRRASSVLGWVTAWEHGVPLRTAPSVVGLTNYPAHIPFARYPLSTIAFGRAHDQARNYLRS